MTDNERKLCLAVRALADTALTEDAARQIAEDRAAFNDSVADRLAKEVDELREKHENPDYPLCKCAKGGE